MKSKKIIAIACIGLVNEVFYKKKHKRRIWSKAWLQNTLSLVQEFLLLGRIIPETCKAICHVLRKGYLKVKQREIYKVLLYKKFTKIKFLYLYRHRTVLTY